VIHKKVVNSPRRFSSFSAAQLQRNSNLIVGGKIGGNMV
jgi:hypothetical protein